MYTRSIMNKNMSIDIQTSGVNTPLTVFESLRWNVRSSKRPRLRPRIKLYVAAVHSRAAIVKTECLEEQSHNLFTQTSWIDRHVDCDISVDTYEWLQSNNNAVFVRLSSEAAAVKLNRRSTRLFKWRRTNMSLCLSSAAIKAYNFAAHFDVTVVSEAVSDLASVLERSAGWHGCKPATISAAADCKAICCQRAALPYYLP